MKDTDTLVRIATLKRKGHLFIYGKTRFGVDWDTVIERVYSRPANLCFFCDKKLKRGGPDSKRNDVKTKDHLIPGSVLDAYGIVVLEDNTVPCCITCNQEKANLHPYVYRSKLQYLLKNNHRDQKRRRKVLSTLNLILIKDHDIFE